MQALKKTLASTWRSLLRPNLVLPCALLGVASACGSIPESSEAPEAPALTQRADRLTTTVALEPEADTFVVYGAVWSNFGDWSNLVVAPAWNSPYQRQYTFLRFNLSSLPPNVDVTSVKLQATGYTGHAFGGDGNVYAYLMTTDAWNEMELNWQNMPDVTGSALGSWSLFYMDNTADQVASTETPALAAAVRAELSGDKKISLRLGSNGYTTYYYSREVPDPAKRPKLIISYSESGCTPTAPALVINGGSVQTVECGSGAYTDLGAQASDGCGNAVEVHAYNTGADSSGPGPNLNAEGVYSVSYSAWNAQGDANATRTVIVDDSTPPTLTLKGPAFMTHTCNSMWIDPGVEATDACYGDLTHTVQRTGEVNGWAEGTYTVTYSVTDSGGNSATPVTRTVEVVDCPW